MMKIEIFGSGCSNCIKLYDMVAKVVSENEIAAEVVKVTDMKEIVSRGIMRTPGLAVNGKVVCTGRVPKIDEVKKWVIQQ
jgi:small redox-active disulfide protein 2